MSTASWAQWSGLCTSAATIADCAISAPGCDPLVMPGLAPRAVSPEGEPSVFGTHAASSPIAPWDADKPNLRQVHLIHDELFGDLRGRGFDVKPGEMGENITTSGLDLLSLPTGTFLRIGDEAVIEVTGLRNPCAQLDQLAPGLIQATLDSTETGELIRLAGVMGVVIASGAVRPGHEIGVDLPEDHRALQPV